MAEWIKRGLSWLRPTNYFFGRKGVDTKKTPDYGKPPVTVNAQEILDLKFGEQIAFDPANARKFFTDNKVVRTLAHLIAKAESGAIPIAATESGALVVSPTVLAIEHNETVADQAYDTPVVAITFTKTVSRVTIYCFDNPLWVERSLDGIIYDSSFFLPANTTLEFDCSTKKIRVTNKIIGMTARYQIIGWRIS